MHLDRCSTPVQYGANDRIFVHMQVCTSSCAYLLIITHEHSHRLTGAPGWERTALKPASLTVLKPQFLAPPALNLPGRVSKWARRLHNCLDSFQTVWTVLKRAGGFKMVLNINKGHIVFYVPAHVSMYGAHHVCMNWDI